MINALYFRERTDAELARIERAADHNAAYVASHGAAVVTLDADTLTVCGTWTRMRPNGRPGHRVGFGWRIQTIPNTRAAVRAYLGY